MPKAAEPQRRGTLMDSSKVANMLTAVKAADDSESDASGGSDWDSDD